MAKAQATTLPLVLLHHTRELSCFKVDCYFVLTSLRTIVIEFFNGLSTLSNTKEIARYAWYVLK